MLKKGLLKKITVFAIMGIMSLSLIACDKKETEKEKEDKTEEITEEITEEAEPVIPEDAEEFNGVYFVVPEGFTKDAAGSDATAVAYLNEEEGIAFVMAVDTANSATESAAMDAFDAQIKQVFGTHVTSSPVSYNGYSATEWVTDATDDSYEGRSLVICDGSLLIYVEYVSYTGGLGYYDDLVESIVY
ncbi:MAG: hypothetical protein J6J16_10610 [Lachnospiraceae bacterium]|nr:hypothetical protein [Lachnospiraceae bacterium]